MTTPTNREDIRNKIFNTTVRCNSVQVDFFGTQIEIRQPTVGRMQKMMDERSEGNKFSMAHYLIEYAYMPGEDVKVFEPGDVDSIMALPYNEDMIRVAETITKLTTLDLDAAEKN
jgi:hypothetical protein